MSLGSTQPSDPNKNAPDDLSDTQESRVTRQNDAARQEITQEMVPEKNSFWKNGSSSLIITLLLFLGGLLILVSASGWFGYRSGQDTRFAQATITMEAYIANQFAQAVGEVSEGNYELAMERLIYIRSIRTDLHAVNELYDDLAAKLNITPTPIIPTATITPSPTPDLRPAAEMYDSVLSLISLGEWSTALDTLANLREVNPSYNIVEVDGLIFLCLRNRGVEKIMSGDLEGGIYDFTLAEQFGPLDGETESYRSWARLYLLGNAFWGAYPEQAAYYYGQLVSAAPSITDASGVSAFYRYWASLVQIAENSAAEENWCDAQLEIETALGAWNQAEIQPTATYYYEECYNLLYTETPTPTMTLTVTETGMAITPTFSTATLTPTPGGATNTPTPTTSGNTPTYTFTPTPEPVVNTPTETITPTATPLPTTLTPGE
ncbi:hypothetical protein KQH61_04595 [bacterium]|nr:hypothetical protein [bacterium]MCB2179183.1 hypothetical protein [bacterium]